MISEREFETGRRYLDKAVNGVKAEWPDGHWRIGQAHAGYAYALGQNGYFEEAIEQGKLAWAAYEKNPNPLTSSVRSVATELARYYEALGDKAGAEHWTNVAGSMADPATQASTPSFLVLVPWP